MRVGGVLWERRPARRAGRRPKLLSSFRRFLIANGISLMGCRGERFYFPQWVVTAASLPTALRPGSRLAGRAIEVHKNFEGL